jgi:hypothetical protein
VLGIVHKLKKVTDKTEAGLSIAKTAEEFSMAQHNVSDFKQNKNGKAIFSEN